MVGVFQGNPFSNLPPLAQSIPSGLQGGTLPLNLTPTSYWNRGSNVPGPTPPTPPTIPTLPTSPSGVFDQFAAQRAAATTAPQLGQQTGQLGATAVGNDPRVAEMAQLYADAGRFAYPGFQVPQFDPQAFLRLMGNYGSSGTQGGGETGTGNTGAGESPGIGGGIGP